MKNCSVIRNDALKFCVIDTFLRRLDQGNLRFLESNKMYTELPSKQEIVRNFQKNLF